MVSTILPVYLSLEFGDFHFFPILPLSLKLFFSLVSPHLPLSFSLSLSQYPTGLEQHVATTCWFSLQDYCTKQHLCDISIIYTADVTWGDLLPHVRVICSDKLQVSATRNTSLTWEQAKCDKREANLQA